MKKRSGASYRSKLLEPLDLFLDRGLGRHTIAGKLRAQPNIRVYVHDDHFKTDEQDEVWGPKVASQGWVILTKDKKIRHRTLEREVLLSWRAYAFFPTAGDLKGEDMGEAFLAALPQIRRLVAHYEPPLLATVSATGSIVIL